MYLSKLIPGFSIDSSLQNQMRKCGKGNILDNQTPIWWPIWLGSIMCYWLILIVNHHHLCHLSECGILCHDSSRRWWHNDRHHPHHICHRHIAIIIIISLMLLDVVFCVIVCPEDGGATQPNKWWQPEPKGIYRMGAAMDKIWTNKQIRFWAKFDGI